MELRELRELVSDYKKTHTMRISIPIFGRYHRRAIKIDEFLNSLNDKEDQYALEIDDIYKLVRLISSLDPSLTLILEIRKALHLNDVFFDVIHDLDLIIPSNELDAEIFPTLYRNSRFKDDNFSETFKNLFNQCEPLLHVIPTSYNKALFIKILLKFQEEYETNEITKFIKIFMFLRRNFLLTTPVLTLINDRFYDFKLFGGFISAIESGEDVSIEFSHLQHFFDFPNIEINKLLKFVIDSEIIELSSKIMSQIVANTKEKKTILKLCNDIFELNPHWLDEKTLTNLLTLNHFSSITELISRLVDKRLLTKPTFEAILHGKESIDLANILNFLLNNHPLLLTEANIKIMLMDNHKKTSFEYIEYLSEIESLTEDSLYKISTNSLADFWKIRTLTNLPGSMADRKEIWEKLIKLNNEYSCLECIIKNLKGSILHTKTNILELLSINSSYLSIINQKLENLDKLGHLNEESFQLLLDKIHIKLPMPIPADIELEPLKDDPIFLTRYHNTNNQSYFYSKKIGISETYRSGRGRIYEGFETNGNTETEKPDYLIKEIYQNDPNPNLQFKEARREVKYLRFFGRKAELFKADDDSICLYADWVDGKALDYFTSEQFMAIPFKKRLESILSCLESLNNLHSIFRVHGDIKRSNCIYNPKINRLTWIDFGSTRKMKQKDFKIARTPEYLDEASKNENKLYSFCDDMYGLGIVLATLFPEMYLVKIKTEQKKVIKFIKPLSEATIEELAIYHLVSSLTDTDHSARCTSKLALDYCQTLLQELDYLTINSLKDIVIKTLTTYEFSAEDIIQDRCARPTYPAHLNI